LCERRGRRREVKTSTYYWPIQIHLADEVCYRCAPAGQRFLLLQRALELFKKEKYPQVYEKERIQ